MFLPSFPPTDYVDSFDFIPLSSFLFSCIGSDLNTVAYFLFYSLISSETFSLSHSLPCESTGSASKAGFTTCENWVSPKFANDAYFGTDGNVGLPMICLFPIVRGGDPEVRLALLLAFGRQERLNKN